MITIDDIVCLNEISEQEIYMLVDDLNFSGLKNPAYLMHHVLELSMDRNGPRIVARSEGDKIHAIYKEHAEWIVV